MRKALTVILAVCILLSTVSVSASEDVYVKISQLYLEKTALSVWEALGLSLNGYRIPDSYYATLKEDIVSRNGVYRTSLEYAKIIILLKQGGKNPKDFHGYNLVSLLQSFKNIDKSGINGVIFTIFALNDIQSESNAIWTKDNLLPLLLEYQNEDGGFPLVKGWGSDNDLTAMAVSALAYYPDNKQAKEAMDKALSYLSGKLDNDGFMYYQNSDSSEILSQIIIALSTAGISLNDSRFVRNNKTLYDTLIEKYMTKDFRFRHSISQEANDMATEQAYLALSAIKTGYVYAKKEKTIVPDPTPSPSPTASSTVPPEIIHEPTDPDVAKKTGFSDEERISKRYYSDVLTAYTEKLVVGDGSNLRPLDNLTRAEACAILYNVAQLGINVFIPRFKDIGKESWYSKYVIACYLNGIMFGADEVCFEPDSYITVFELTESINRMSGTDVVYDDGFITREAAISLIVRIFYGGFD